jgi:hypothetical protein
VIEDRISELEDISMEFTESKQQRENTLKIESQKPMGQL